MGNEQSGLGGLGAIGAPSQSALKALEKGATILSLPTEGELSDAFGIRQNHHFYTA